ncbi:hypothetical protein [Microbulbifer halophilus]
MKGQRWVFTCRHFGWRKSGEMGSYEFLNHGPDMGGTLIMPPGTDSRK